MEKIHTDQCTQFPEQDVSDEQVRALYPAISPWLAGLLLIVSFGLYMPMYFYFAARDCKYLHHPDTRPWLWALSPLLAITLPFSTERLIDRYAESARRCGGEAPRRGTLLGVGLFVTFAASNASDVLNISVVWDLGMLIAAAFVFSILVKDINIAKAIIRGGSSEDRFPLTKGTWAVLILGVLSFVPIYGYLGYIEWRESTWELLPPGQRWMDKQNLFSVEPQWQWRVADIGSYSDGSAAAEFAYDESTSVVIFDHTGAASVDEIMTYRRKEMLELDEQATCAELRTLLPNSTIRRVELYCQSPSIFNPKLLVIVVLESQQHVVEAYGVVDQSSTSSIKKIRAIVRDLMHSMLLEPNLQDHAESSDES